MRILYCVNVLALTVPSVKLAGHSPDSMETEDPSRDSMDLFSLGAESSRLGASKAAKVSVFLWLSSTDFLKESN
jgi:hypothetical protein